MSKASRHNAMIWTAVLLSSIFLAACSGAAPQAAEAPGLELGDTTWKLESVNGVASSSDETALIYFGNESGLVGYTGCNIISGNYEVSGSQIDIPVNVVTPFNCSDTLQLQEQALVQTLTQASTAQIEAEKLTISNPDGSLTASFIRTPSVSISGTSWTLNAFNNGEGAFVNVIPGTEITAEFSSDGNLAGSAGCNNYSATYTTDGSSISIGPAVSTMMACAEPTGIMEQETQYLTALPTTNQYLNLEAVLYLSDAENDPVALYIAAQP